LASSWRAFAIAIEMQLSRKNLTQGGRVRSDALPRQIGRQLRKG
jgi:hypothetical protein